jgi:hypothetical protein
MKTLKDFTDEFRLISYDSFEDAKEAWFEAAGQMNKRGLAIPNEWAIDFRGGDGTEPDSHWHEDFEQCTDELLIRIANFTFRYCRFLQHKGLGVDES